LHFADFAFCPPLSGLGNQFSFALVPKINSDYSYTQFWPPGPHHGLYILSVYSFLCLCSWLSSLAFRSLSAVTWNPAWTWANNCAFSDRDPYTQ
jgi:hypothetical protein